MTTKEIAARVSKFNTLKSAKSFADRCVKGQLIIMGDDGLFWVANMGFAAKLEKLGYEVV